MDLNYQGFFAICYWISHFKIDGTVLTEKSIGIDRYTLKEKRENYIFGSRSAFTKSIFLSFPLLVTFYWVFSWSFFGIHRVALARKLFACRNEDFFLNSFNVHRNFYSVSLALGIHLSSSSVFWRAFSLPPIVHVNEAFTVAFTNCSGN